MNMDSVPSLEQFLTAPIDEVVKVAPATAIYAAGGTRRRAAFESIEPWSDEFMQWARQRILGRIDLLFRHGIRNVIVNVFSPDNYKEVNRYREQLLERAKWVVAGDESLLDYGRWGWRVRLLGTENVPPLQATAELVRTITPAQSTHTLYWTVVPDAGIPWQQVLAAAQRANVQTQAEAIRALYGEDIPLATLYLAFGKPTISLDLIPPLLVGQLQCYWSQQPGYTLTQRQLRTILYDYAFLRSTWREEKLERAKEAIAHRRAWEEGPILGLGMQLGPFWYPAPMFSPAWTNEGES
jgi:hypothetical protein